MLAARRRNATGHAGRGNWADAILRPCFPVFGPGSLQPVKLLSPAVWNQTVLESVQKPGYSWSELLPWWKEEQPFRTGGGKVLSTLGVGVNVCFTFTRRKVTFEDMSWEGAGYSWSERFFVCVWWVFFFINKNWRRKVTFYNMISFPSCRDWVTFFDSS